ncbi:hypothetical protein [Planococcus halotolerans]|nr:hypothetical protein [Planococcus halotolerans]QHJ70042.1 hypothetical protein DNR44_005255 [Planococcus halotolerans]
MRAIRIIFLILILVAVIYWLWTGDTQFLPYVMLTVSTSMLFTPFPS